MAGYDRPRIGDRIVRRPRTREVLPTLIKPANLRHPSRLFTPPYILLFGFVSLILIGTLFLSLPLANNQSGMTPFATAMFTSTSAVTVTGLTVEPTSTYWSNFGQGVIFALMLIGGLGFMTVATFLLSIMGQRITLSERMLLRDTMGVDRMGELVRVTRNIILIVAGVYAVGTVVVWWHLSGFFSGGEALWQAAFLTVSSFNNAGLNILPDVASGDAFVSNFPLLGSMAFLIILGSIGWATLVDLRRHRRFSRLSLDTRMVLVTSLFLYGLGAAVIFLAEFDNDLTLGRFSTVDQAFYSIFHSISGRTAGFNTIDFSQAKDLSLLFYPFLMFIGGAAGSVAGGIKVATFAVIIAAVLSSVRGRLHVEAFGREIPPLQVHRALSVVVIAMVLIFVVSLALTFTEEEIPFLHLLFDTVSAFGTSGLSTGVPTDLSDGGKALFMLLMLAGRLGPLTMALALVPREEVAVYRFAQERVKIG